MILGVFAGCERLSAQDSPVVSPLYGAPPAPSAITIHFLAVATPTVAVFYRASLLAEHFAGARRQRAFAARQVHLLPSIAQALDAATAPTPVGHDPLDAAAVAAASVDENAETILSMLPRILRTPGARAIAADRAISSQGAADLARLTTLAGTDFDALYKEISRQALDRLVTVCRDYVQNGDDPTLRAIAVHTLPILRGQRV